MTRFKQFALRRSLFFRCLLYSALFLNAIVLWTQGVNKRVQFAPGHHSATLEGAVIRGDRDRYIVGARAGQTMSVAIRSVEDNAVFQIAKPGGGEMLAAASDDDATRWSGTLPVSGDYVITVGGTRGNATYNLSVAIH
jgi:hypothetical protein